MKTIIVALGIVVRHGAILLIKRKQQGIIGGFWAIPVGKVEIGEHISSAATRELHEETGLEATFERELGVVSELIHGNE